MANESADMLHNLKRRRTRERTNANRFSTMLEGFEDSSFDDIEHYRGRLQETLDLFHWPVQVLLVACEEK